MKPCTLVSTRTESCSPTNEGQMLTGFRAEKALAGPEWVFGQLLTTDGACLVRLI